jgi:Zn-dependent protease with chaperone function
LNVSRSFLLGLGAALLSDLIVEWLPGEARYGRLFATLLVMPVPYLWATATGARLRQLAAFDGRPWPLLLVALRLQPLTVPAAYLVLLAVGGLGALAEQAAPDSHTVRFALLLAPLLLLEASLRAAERRVMAVLDARRFAHPIPLGPTFVGMTVFVVAAVLLFGIGLDVVAVHRGLEVFFHGTAIGATAGMLVMVVALTSALPILFRLVMPTSRALPDRVAGEVWAAASRLGFPPRSVLSLWTEQRLVNAALVGPLPWPRYLVLTDGILEYLDVLSLRGVVAHEVGHARAGHPALLLLVFGVVPILLAHPLMNSGLGAVDPLWLLAAGAIAALSGFFLIRALMHRFEFEADQLSAVALGGALPCIAALRRVGDLFPSQRGRASFRHPSEEQRVRALSSWDADPEYRAAFLRRGRAVRRLVAGLCVLALGLSVWSHARTLPYDLAVQRLYTGDFEGAAVAIAGYGREPEATLRLREEIEAARALLPGGGDWELIRDELADRAWERGLLVYAAAGPEAARPLLALATVGARRDPLRELAWRFAEAEVAGDEGEEARLRAHLQGLPELPDALRRRLGGD